MRVFYDHQIFCEQTFGGISRYYYELIKGSRNLNLYYPIIDVKFSNNVFCQLIKPDSNWLTNAEFKGKKDIVKFLNKINTRINTKIIPFDIFHPTYFDQSALKNRRGKPMILTVLDMIDEKYHIGQPNFKKLIINRALMIKAADHIIAISENTRKDIIQYFNVEEDRVTTIHLGCSLDAEMINLYQKDESSIISILFLGSRKGTHKNFINYLQALKIVAEFDSNIEFIFGGGGAFTIQEKEQICKVDLERNIKYIPINSDADIIKLYKNATVLVYPSLYEGFGLPLVEAFNCGTPCITAKGSCLEEVGGEAAIYFDPLNPVDIANKVITAIENPNLRNDLITKGYQRAKLFTWGNTVSNTFKVYEKVLDKKKYL